MAKKKKEKKVLEEKLEDLVSSPKRYLVSDPSDADRVLDVLGVRLVFDAGSKEKMEVSEDIASVLKIQYPYLVVEEV